MNLYRGYFVPNDMDPDGKINCKPSSSCCVEECMSNGETNEYCVCCCNSVCGPDATAAFNSFLARVAPSLRSLPRNQVGKIDGVRWLATFGGNIDFYLALNIKLLFPGCATGKCAGSVMYCGKCVRQTVLNNILYGVVARAHGVPKKVATAGADANNLGRGEGWEGGEQKVAYSIGYGLWDELLSHYTMILSSVAICKRFNWVNDLFGVDDHFRAFNGCQPCGLIAQEKDFGKVGIGGTKYPALNQ
jgi:hypothetical protein